MEKKGWLALAILFAVITIVLLILVIVLPIVTKEDEGKDEWHKQSLPKKDNTELWASFPGKLQTKTIHTFSILDYTEIKNKAKIKNTVVLEETTKYDNFDFPDKEKKVYFDAKSTFTLNSNQKEKNEEINTMNLGLFEALETISNPPLYQKSINSIHYLFLKAFQSADIFIRHLFASSFYKSFIIDEQKVLANILNNVDSEKSKKILSTATEYAEYSFKSVTGFYQWVKILGKQEEIEAASWLRSLFELTTEEINSIIGDDKYLNNQFEQFNKDLATTYKCKESKCGNELIYTQLISGEVIKTTIPSLDSLKALYKEINENIYPFYSSPELNIYFEEYKEKKGQSDIKYDDYKVDLNTLEKLLEQNSELSLLSANNSALFLSLVQTKDEEKINKVFGLTLKQSLFLCDYLYEFLPKLFLYQEFKDGEKIYTINPGARAYYNLIEKYVEQTYYPLIHTEHNIYNLFFAKYVWRGLHYSLLNLSMEYDDEDICPLLMQHALDDGRKVLKICSDPVTAFNTPLEILKWYDPYPCVKSGDESKCNMTVIEHLRSIVYITEDEIKSIYDQGGLGKLFEDNDSALKQAFNCDGECTNDYLCKIQFWKSGVTQNLPSGISKTDTLNEIFPDEFPIPMELTYFAKQIGYTDGEFLEEDINDLISLSPAKVSGILKEENYEAFNNKVKIEKEYTLVMAGKESKEKRYNAMNVLSNAFLFSKDIGSKYDNADNVLQGSSTDKKYLDFLSSGEYYENYKPGIQRTTGFNFGINLNSDDNTTILYDRYGICTEDNSNIRKIISINECPFLNIKKLEYNYLTNDYTYINSPLFNFQTLTGDKSFIDGFQYDHDRKAIYYYDKISSRPFKFDYKEEVDYGDESCRKYVLDKNDIANGINEKDDLEANKALLSQKLNKPFVVTVGKDDLNTEVEDEISTENYICVQPDSNMVLDSKINFVYSLYTKKYGFIDSNIENEKIYPIFIYNRNYKVDMQSFNSIFEEEEEKKLGTAFSVCGFIGVVLLCLLACFFFYKYWTYRRQGISLNEGTSTQNLINDTREPTTNTKIEALD